MFLDNNEEKWDYVLEDGSNPDEDEKIKQSREYFFAEIKNQKVKNGLIIEKREEKLESGTKNFYLIAASNELLELYAEFLQIELPIGREGNL